MSARHDPLKIGVMIFSDANTVLTSVGAATEEPDYKILQSTIIAHINKTGGVAGHPLVPVYYDVKTADSPQDTSEKACTKWTQDDHVFVAIPSAPVEDKGVLRECLGRAGTLALYPNLYSTTRERDFNRWPLWFESEAMSLEAWANTYAVGLARQGFFKGTRVGVIYDEDSDFTAVAESVLLPGLRAQGANVVATYQSSIHSLADLSSGSAEMSNAVLQFQSAHVTNVLFFEKWVGWAAFAAQAEGQRYYPVYGLSSQSGPQTMLETGLVPTTQLPRARLVSWNQNVDVQPRFGTTWARLGLCREIFRRAKVDITSHGQEGYYGALVVCGGLLALQDAGRVARQPLTPAKLAQALEQLGQNLQTPSVPATRFDGNRHFGAAGWRPASFDESCECFKYTGPVSRF